MALWRRCGSALILFINEELYVETKKELNVFTLSNLTDSQGPHQELPTLLKTARDKPGTCSKHKRELKS